MGELTMYTVTHIPMTYVPAGRTPIFVGGGVVFGPRPCDYSKKVNKSTRRLALRRVLGDLIAASKVSTVSEFSSEQILMHI